MNRSTLEKRFTRFGLELSAASPRTRIEAAGRYEERLPRWQIGGGSIATVVKGFLTLAEVETYLDELVITRGQ